MAAEQLDDQSRAVPLKTPEMTRQSLSFRYADLEIATWGNLRRMSLSAAGGGLAISFLVLQIDGAREPDVFPFPVFSWIWVALLVALFLGMSSYLWRASGLRNLVRLSTAATDDPHRPFRVSGSLSWQSRVERTSVVLAVLAIVVAFTLLVIAGFSLIEVGAAPPPIAILTP